jgi:hypothetical protein
MTLDPEILASAISYATKSTLIRADSHIERKEARICDI